jgi:GTP-binding protein HflX
MGQDQTGFSTEPEPETAFVIDVLLKSQSSRDSIAEEDHLREAVGLAAAISISIIDSFQITLTKLVAGTLITKGKREEIKRLCEEYEPSVVIINHPLTPVQQRNLEKLWGTKVIDRTGLILEIFGERAQTREGKIQVELAALDYQKSRLVRSWTHLERQRGGAGFMGGPGERQIELDRRMITQRISRLKKDLEHVKKTRDMQKRSREKVPYPVVSLVGYTNAGKSTLFNTITGAKVFAKDLLFATLDPTMRKKELENGQDIILSDTVGFIRDLPTHLIAAFRATLEHVIESHVIVHIIDASDPNWKEQRRNVIQILESLGIDYEQDPRIIEGYNKIDQIEEGSDLRTDLYKKVNFTDNCVALSALNGEGIDSLLKLVGNNITSEFKVMQVNIPHHDASALSWVYKLGSILQTDTNEDNMQFVLKLSDADIGRFESQFSYNLLPCN